MPPQSVLPPADIPANHPTTRTKTVAALLLIAAVALAFGWPTQHGGSIPGDDERLALSHVLVNHPSLANAARLLTIIHGDLYQPLPVLSFQLNYALAQPLPSSPHGVGLYGFHLTNILLHAVNAILVFLVASHLAACRRIGLLTALFFACHPFASEPVAWISGRTILLATLFSLLLFLTLPLRVGRESTTSFAASVAIWLFALASKVLPTVPIAALWCDQRLHGPIPKRRWTVYAILLVISGAATWLVYRATSQAGFIEAMEAEAADPLPIRILLAARYYLENYFWPSRLAGWSPPPLGNSFSSAPVIIAWVEILALLILIAATRWRHPTVCLGLGLFLILIAPFLAASAARRLLAADRYMYLPIVGLHLAVAAAMVALFDALRRRTNLAVASLAIGVPALTILVAWFCNGQNLGRTWGNNVARNQRALEVYRDNVLAHVELAKAYVIDRQPDAALAAVEQARQQWPDHPRIAGVAGEAHRLKKDWPAAEKELRRAAAGLPHHLWTLYYLARTLDDMGKANEAREHYDRILKQNAQYLPALIALAHHYERADNVDAAIETYERALAVNSHDRDALNALAVLHIRRQDWKEAEPLLRSVLQLDPTNESTLLNLGVVLARTDRASEALEMYDRLIATNAGNLTARLNRASLLAQLGRATEAESDYRAILSKNPDDRAAMIGLHETLQSSGNYHSLVDLWRKYKGESFAQDEQTAWRGWSLALTGDSRQAVQNALTLQPGTEARDFAAWTIAYVALTKGETRAIPAALGQPKPPSLPSATRIEWLRAVTMALEALPPTLRESSAGLYLLARISLENGNPALAEQAAKQVIDRTDDELLKQAANIVLGVIAESQKQPSTSPHKFQPPDGFAG